MMERQQFKSMTGADPSVVFNAFCFKTDKIALVGSLVDGRYFIARRDHRNKNPIWRWTLYPTQMDYRLALKNYQIRITEMISI